jgi:hypothetical protein
MRSWIRFREQRWVRFHERRRPPALPHVDVPHLPAPTVRARELPAYHVETDAWGVGVETRVDPAEMTGQRATAIQAAEDADRRAAREAGRQRYMNRDPVQFAAVYARWSANGFPGKRPPEVTRWAERSRQKGMKAKARGFLPKGQKTAEGLRALTPEQRAEVNRAGQAAYRGTLAAWAAFYAKRQTPRGKAGKALPAVVQDLRASERELLRSCIGGRPAAELGADGERLVRRGLLERSERAGVAVCVTPEDVASVIPERRGRGRPRKPGPAQDPVIPELG